MLRRIYAGWLSLVAVLIVVQLYLAGYGVFAFNGLKAFDAHLVLGDVIVIAILIIQFLLAHTPSQVISALHIVNGVAIMGVSGFMTGQAWMLARGGEKASA